VTVRDDDAAGLVTSSENLNATFDNYGDPLLAANLTVRLASKPLAAVALSFGEGLSAHCNASPASATVSPEDWRSPVAVAVACGAATGDRPVCASSRSPRFCAALEGSGGKRREALSVRVASSDDPTYAAGGGAVPAVSVSVTARVVRDPADPPKVAFARFGDLLNSLTVGLDADSDQAGGLTGAFACDSVFDLTAGETSALFGATSTCSFASASSLRVVFGRGASLVPGDRLGFRERTLKASAATSSSDGDADGAGLVAASLFTANATFSVGQPLVPTTPAVSLSASSAAVGRCDGLTLDGSRSSGSGGRAMK